MSALSRPSLKKVIVACLVVWMILVGLVPRDVMAMLIPSPSGETLGQRDQDLQQIRVHLESKLVAQKLNSLGLTPEEVQAKLSQLGDDQIHQVAQLLDGVQAGGFHGLLITIGVILGLILIFLILVGH